MSSRMRPGVSPLSWTNDVLEDFGADIALETCLRQAAQAGYQGIELGRKFPRTVAALTPLLQAVGLQLASAGTAGFWRNVRQKRNWRRWRLMPIYCRRWA